MNDYKKILKDVHILVGHKGSTNGSELYKFGKGLFKNRFVGVYSIDTIPIKKIKCRQCLIFNTDPSYKRGDHWVALYKGDGNTFYIYDSFGRKSAKLLKTVISSIHQNHYNYRDSEHDAEQKSSQSNCGHRCLTWLLCVYKLGIRKALMI